MTAFDTSTPILAEAELALFGLLPPGLLIALLVVVLVAVVLVAGGGWLVLRRVRQAELGRRGRELAQSGLFSVGAMALPAGRRELAALGAQVDRSRNDLARYYQQATTAGRYVGEADSLVPRLLTEGDRLLAELRRLTIAGIPSAGEDRTGVDLTREDRTGVDLTGGSQAGALAAEAEDYVQRVQRLLGALRSVSSSAGSTAVTGNEIDDAVAGLRASEEAYRQFMRPSSPPPPPLPARDRPGGDAGGRS